MNQIRPEVISLVNKILHEKFEVPLSAMNPTANIKDDLQLDSLDFVDMFVLLEEHTASAPKNLDILNIRTLNDIYNLVNELEFKTSASEAQL